MDIFLIKLHETKYMNVPLTDSQLPLGLDIRLLSYDNRLCPSFYRTGIHCATSGKLIITLSVNGEVVELHSNSRKPVHVGGFVLTPWGKHVGNMSYGETYFMLKIEPERS